MSTVIRPEISKSNVYWIPKHRYYELKHFCLQYPYWKKLYISSGNYFPEISQMTVSNINKSFVDPTSKYAIKFSDLSKRLSIIIDSARKTDLGLSKYLIKAVTEGFSYEYLRTKLDIPCSRDTYYECYRRFFWLLDKIRD